MAAAAQGQGMSPEQAAKAKEAAAKAENEKKVVGTLNEKLNAAKTASDAGDFETAIATLNDAIHIDSTRDLIWFKLADAYRMSAPKQTDPEEKQKRYEMAAADYQKAIEMRSTSETAQKDPDNNKNMAAYYNNLAEVYAKSNKVDDPWPPITRQPNWIRRMPVHTCSMRVLFSPMPAKWMMPLRHSTR